jgi:hypothetical protein
VFAAVGEVLNVLDGNAGVNRQTVMRERVHERRDEFGPATGGPGVEGHVGEAARLI